MHLMIMPVYFKIHTVFVYTVIVGRRKSSASLRYKIMHIFIP